MKVNGMQVPLNTKVGHLPVGVQQKVEIIKNIVPRSRYSNS